MIKLLLTFFQANKPPRRPQGAFSLLCLLTIAIFYTAAANNMAGATTYYLDAANGNDNNDGSSTSPWKTMARALPNYSAGTPKVIGGDTVYLRTGSYGQVTISYNPSLYSNFPTDWNTAITYRAVPGQRPVFNYLEITNDYPRYLIFDGIFFEDETTTGRDYLIYLRTSDHIKFLNLKMTGSWSKTMWYGLTANGIHASIAPQGSNMEDVTIEGCDISKTLRGIMFTCVSPGKMGSNIVIKNNHIHDLAGTAINLAVFDATDTILVEGNDIYNEDPVVQTQTITGTITSAFTKNEVVTQLSTGATGTIYSTSGSEVIIYPTSQVIFEAGPGRTISGANGGEMTNPTTVQTGYSHASCVTMRCRNVTVRNNTFHSYGTTSGIMTYPPYTNSDPNINGYTNITVENNLFYDMSGVYAVRLENLGSNIRFNNNTVIGYYITSGKGVSRYGTQVRLLPLDGLADEKRHDIFFYNNIVVGAVNLSYQNMHLTGFSEDYNIFWACDSPAGGLWLPAGTGSLQGSHTIIYTGDTSEPSVFETGFFVDPDYSRGTDFVKYTDGGPKGSFLNYHLLQTAQAVDFCSGDNGTATDLNGNSRIDIPSVGNDGTNYADVGCYEYTTSDSNTTSYSLTITAANGSVSKTPDKSSYSSGETVTLQATPNTGYHFVNWTGDASGTSDSVTITMNSNKSVTANFAINTYTLTITATNGSVSKTPSKSSYNYGESVTLAATANTGYHFSNWSGDASGTSSTTTIVMNSNKSVTANFSINTYSLTVEASNGSVTKTPDKTTYNYGEQVTLQAVPNTGYHFTDWWGGTSGTSNPTTITMNANKLVVANFAINTYTLGITAVFGSVTKSPNKTLYNHGETVSLQAVPNSGHDFTGWAGDASGSSNPVSLTMDSNKSVTANFVYTLVDNNAPSIAKSRCYPLPNAIQVPLNTLLVIHIVDEGRGIDANTVSIEVNNNIIYTGNVSSYSSTYGRCQRRGDIANYRYIYQPYQSFDFDQSVTAAVSAADLAGNQMSDSYSFRTEMLSFGKNLKVNSGTDSLADGHPATLRDSSGNIWAAWQKGNVTSRDIYISKLTAGNGAFETSTQLTTDASDQCSPAIAKDSTDKLYVVWQDNRRGNWDIYLSTSVDGISWSAATRITDSNANQVNPAIAIDRSSPNKVYVAWQDDQNVNQDIFVATSTDSFLTKTIAQVASDNSDQTEPAIVTDAANTAYIFWTDLRNGSKDIYGAASTGGLWSNVAIVTGSGDQSEPAVAAEAAGATLHLLWVNNSSGNKDIFYASCSGSLQALSGASITDGTSGADQPSISVTGSTGNNLKVFACWRDERNTDTDLYFAQIGSGSGTNIFVGDNGTGAKQSTPVIGINASGYPYLLWVDNRNTNADIFYAGSTHARTTPLFAQNVSMASGTTIGKGISAITNQDDICVVIPAGTYLCDVNITGSRIENPPNLSISFLSALYEFGPSGITFDQPVTLIIPYIASGSGSGTIYWYDILTAAASQEGVTNVEDITIFGTLHAIRFKTDHFTPFFVGSGGSSDSGDGGGGGGGGCSLAPPGKNGNIIEFVLPFLALGLVITVIKRRDRQNHKRLISKINKV